MFLGAQYAREVSTPIDVRRRGVAETQDLSFVQSLGEGQRWDMAIGLQTDVFGKLRLLPKMKAHKRRNQHGKAFDVLVPQELGFPDPPSGFVLVAGAAGAAGATTVYMKRTSAVRWDIPESRYITFAGDTKVYAVQEMGEMPMVNVNYAVEIYPALRQPVALNAAVDVTPDMRVKWHPDHIDEELMYTNGSIFTYKARFAEDV